MKTRFAASIASLGVLLAAPAGALAGGSTSTASQITPTAPARLTTTSATVTKKDAATLPNTGYDLLPETLVGLALVGVGVGLKLRRSGT